MNRVIIESPYRGNVARNEAYAWRCLKDSLARGEAPIAFHLLLTRILNDDNPEERERGIEAGLAWIQVADLVAVYVDLEITKGMEAAIFRARWHKVPVELREIGA